MRTIAVAVVMQLVMIGALTAGPFRLINAVTVANGKTAPSLDIHVDGVPLVKGLRYGQLITLAQAPTGMRTFSVREGAHVLAERSLNLSGASAFGQVLALSGNGFTQPHMIVTWQPTFSGASSGGQVKIQSSFINLSPTWERTARSYFGCWDPDSSMASEGRPVGMARSLYYGLPLSFTDQYQANPNVVCELAATSPDYGMLSLRTPRLANGDHLMTHVLIGSGSAATPFEWLSIDGSQVIARGRGSYATPVVRGPHFLASMDHPEAGVFFESLDDGERVVGFLIGLGSDRRSTWTLLDGHRSGPNEFQLSALDRPGSTALESEIRLRFRTCEDATLEEWRDGRIVDRQQLRRELLPEGCREYQSL